MHRVAAVHRLALPLLVVLALALAGCDSGGDESSTGSGPVESVTGSAPATTDDVPWPMFGRVEQRTHYIPDAPDPPFHMLWEFFAKQLIEFPPVLANGRVIVVNKTGKVFAVDAKTGKVVRQAQLSSDVTGPAYADGIVYLARLDGTLTALDAASVKTKWDFKASSKLESSPLVAEGKVYFGSDDGTFYALDAKTGKVEWQAKLGHQVKASPSFDDGTVYVGDYEGTIWALDASSGKKKWSTDTLRLPPGGGEGGFYSSPAVAFGDVYEARTDGVIYALHADDGKLDWQFPTSNSIYSSPAAAEVPGTPATVYVGSYDHQLYALEADSGKKRWVFNVGGVVPGTPTVVGKTVYTSSFQNKKTFGVDAKTGKQVFEWGSAGFTPMISDGTNVYLTGFQTVWAFDAKDAGEQRAPSRSESGQAPKPPGPNSHSGR